MGFYRDRILPRVVDRACSSKSVGTWRARALDGLAGIVVEPGFGSGTNLEYYPSAVSKVYAIDPAVLGRQLAARRLARTSIDVDFIGLDGQDIPLPDNSCDAGVLTFTLCTIPDPLAALAELRRVIKPGGALRFAEHGLADEPKIQKWQRRIEPSQRRLFDGCHLTREHPALIEAAGFDIDWFDTGYADVFKPISYFYVGHATNPTES